MQQRNQAIIDAIITKAEREFPGALAMIGIYGSFLTGDIHEKSDLDLMILINDPRGYGLASCFIQEDWFVGHDLYCTTWEALEADAEYPHPHISKLMDSKIVYCAGPEYQARLDALRQKARAQLAAPLSLEKVRQHLALADQAFTQAILADSLAEVRLHCGGMIYHAQSIIAMMNRRYFRKGTRRVWEEIGAMEHVPHQIVELEQALIRAETMDSAKEAARTFLKAIHVCFQELETGLKAPNPPVSADNLRGTYEEMISNWRNKLYLSAKTEDAFLAFSSLAAMQNMLSEIEESVAIRHYNVMECYHPEDLQLTARECDRVLTAYLSEYEQAGLAPLCYPNIDAFLKDYL